MISLEEIEELVSKYPELELKGPITGQNIKYYCNIKDLSSNDRRLFIYEENTKYVYCYAKITLYYPYRGNDIFFALHEGKTYQSIVDLKKSIDESLFFIKKMKWVIKEMKLYNKKQSIESDF